MDVVVGTPSVEAVVVATRSEEEGVHLAAAEEEDIHLVGEAIRSGEGSRSEEVAEWVDPEAASEEASLVDSVGSQADTGEASGRHRCTREIYIRAGSTPGTILERFGITGYREAIPSFSTAKA